MIAVAGMPLTAGLPHWTGRIAERDAVAVARLRAAGYGIAGVTHTDEAGFGTMTPRVANPRFPGRAVGGSSGGAAAAVAAGLADVGLGTDTGGSVRIPAAYCDLWAFKPSRGRISAEGVVPLSPTLDCVGLLASDPATLCAAAAVLLDPLPPGPALSRLLADGDAFEADRAVADPFGAIAAGVTSVAVPEFEDVATAHGVVLCAEAYAFHRREVQAGAPFPPAAAAGLRLGARLTPARVAAARATLSAVADRYSRLLGDDGLLLALTLPMAPATRFARAAFVNGVAVPITEANIRFTLAANVAGLPVVAAPVSGLSVQFIGPPGRDEALLAAVPPLVARLAARLATEFGTPGASR
jgi:Asp-tRNA(Asn)/Glu-tRNA(Gln) amidotransferase A subunit family amidase